jgi:hypothetical protein
MESYDQSSFPLIDYLERSVWTTWTISFNANNDTYIFWLSIWASAGKSTIARTVAWECCDRGCLEASFECHANSKSFKMMRIERGHLR